MGNPLIDQGQLNLLKAAVTWNNFQSLNVSAPFLDRPGILLRKKTTGTSQHPTMTGIVQSPQPYMEIDIVIALLKTQPLSDAYKTQFETDTIIGAGIVYPDTTTGLSPYDIDNMALGTVGEILLNGTTPIWGVTLSGVWYINSAAFN
jgi:hypothetical protein